MEPGSTLKHYRILSRIGEGGMGVVYRAEDTRLGRTVALKVLPKSVAGDAERVRRFEREARAASAVNHPGIATLYDFDSDGDTTFLTMEFVEGRTLKQVLKEGPLPADELLRCAAQLADALAAAHRKGVVHRDLKPDNVMAAESGYYKILDFGLARLSLSSAAGAQNVDPQEQETVARDMTEAGKVLGTFAYMSPEQAQGEAVDGRSDQFSLGTLLYEMACGEQPFQGKNPIAVFHAIVHQEPPPLHARRAGVPPELERVIVRCLAKDPAGRYGSADELAAELRRLRQGSGASAAGAAPFRPAVRPMTRRTAVWIGIAAAAGIALLLAAWMVRRDASPAAPQPPEPPPGAAVSTSPDRILVTFFSNRSGDPEADWLVKGVPEMLTTDLAQSPGLELISTQRIYDLLASVDRREEDLDGETAARLARWAGAGVMVSGAIYRPGKTYRIDLQAHDTTTGQVLTANRVEGDDLFQMVDQLAADLRAGLALAQKEGPGVRERATASPEAFRAYSHGLDRYKALDFAGASDGFEEALRHDPGFALATVRLGMSKLLEGSSAEGTDALERALVAPERLPESERLLVEGIVAYFGEANPDLGASLLDRLIEQHPASEEPLLWKALGEAGVRGNPSAALQTLREALEIDANSPAGNAAMIGLLLELHLDSEAEAILEAFLARNPRADADRMRALRPPAVETP